MKKEMKKRNRSERTMGARLDAAKKLRSYCQDFTGFDPMVDDANYTQTDALIASVEESNNHAAEFVDKWRKSTSVRTDLYNNDANGILKSLAPINAYVKAKWGRSSYEAQTVAALISKMRSQKLKKDAANPDAKTVSPNELSFGSITKAYGDLIATLTNLGNEYAPANSNIHLNKMKANLATAEQYSDTVNKTIIDYKMSISKRQEVYKALAAHCTALKDAVQAHFGYNSAEHKLVRKLSV